MPTIRTAAAKGAELTPTEADANMKRTPVEKAADYTLDATHNREFHYLTTAVATVTLPDISAITIEPGDWEVTLYNTLTTAVAVSRNSQNINGSATNLTLAPKQVVTICADATPDGFYTKSQPYPLVRGFMAYKTADQAIATGLGTLTACTFGTESYDTDSSHVTGTGVVTIPAWATKVRWSVNVEFDASATGNRVASVVQQTGTASSPIPRWVTQANGVTFSGGTTGWITVTPGATYRVEVGQDSGGSLNVIGTNNRTYFSAEFAA